MAIQVTFGTETQNNSYEAAAGNYLKPWNIYEVKMTKFAYDTVTGKDGTVYEGLSMEFESEDNKKFNTFVYGVNKQEDLERRVYNDREMPSQFEVLRLTINHVLGAFNASYVEKINKAVAGKQVTIRQYIELAAKAAANCLNKTCYIKIIGNNSNYSSIPRIATVWNNGEEAVISNNFISTDKSKLSFSNYELRKAKEMQERKPQTVETTANTDNMFIPNAVSNSDDDLFGGSSDDGFPF